MEEEKDILNISQEMLDNLSMEEIDNTPFCTI